MLVKDVVNDLAAGRQSVEEAVDQLLEGGVSKAIDKNLIRLGAAAADKLGIGTKALQLYSRKREQRQLGKAILGAAGVAAGVGVMAHRAGTEAERQRQIERRLASKGH